MPRRAPSSDQSKFIMGLMTHILFGALFILFLPLVEIDSDYGRGHRQFQRFLGEEFFGVREIRDLWIWESHAFFRALIFSISFSLVLALYSVRLVTKETLGLYLIWPYAAFLATRMKLEVFAFPFYLIRTDLKAKHEVILIVVFLALGFITERNFLVIGLFRLALLFYKIINSQKWFIILSVIAITFVELGFSLIAKVSPLIARFERFRDFVNPEYSIIESIAVFLASFHLTINPTEAWKFHLPFGLIMFLMTAKTLWKKSPRDSALPAIATYFMLTTLTHGFQKASYYLFYLPAVYAVAYREHFNWILIFGWLHVLLALVYYQFFVIPIYVEDPY